MDFVLNNLQANSGPTRQGPGCSFTVEMPMLQKSSKLETCETG